MSSKNILDKLKDSLNDMLDFGPKGIIGIDIGLSAIKLAEVVEVSKGSYQVNRYASWPLNEGVLIEDEIQKEDELIEALRSAFKKLNSGAKNICIGLYGPNTIIKRMQMAAGSVEEIEDQVMWEAEQYLPFSIEEGNISFSIIGENSGGGVDVIVGAARKSLVHTFKDLLERINLKVKIVDLGAAALINVFDSVIDENERDKTWILIDVGAQKTHFIIYKNQAMVFYKEMNIGGLTITEEIQRQMGVNYEEAESLKIFGDGSGNVPEEIGMINFQVVEMFLAEFKKTIDFWINSTSEEVFDGCYISGGSSTIPGLRDGLQDLFGVEVKTFNLFERFSYNEKYISNEESDEIALRGVCAVGLAMRKISK